jgi:CheY-like chemotaxis protein
MADVIVVDDAPEVAALTTAVLQRLGHSVRTVDSGAAALAELHARGADAIVLDLDMPGVHGWEVLRRVRGDPRLASVRVVIYSASADANTRPGGVAPDAIIAKGLPIPELAAAFGQYI